ncbi:MAG: GNAT family N-acetyltransferase [Bryobacteraceae bacterium]
MGSQVTFSFEVLELNLRATLGVFSRAHPAGEVRSLRGLELICAGVRFSTFNAVLLTDPASDEDELLERLQAPRQYFVAHGLPWSVWLCEEWLAPRLKRRADAIFEAAGLRLLTRMPGMVALRLNPPARRLPSLAFRKVEDEATRRAFEQIMSATFDVPPAIARQIYGAEATWRDGLTGWVGCLRDFPVTSAATRVAAGVVGVYAVGTLPGFRGQGCAEAVMRHALQEAQAASGIETSVLQSTSVGLRLYEKLGYRPVTGYRVYVASR